MSNLVPEYSDVDFTPTQIEKMLPLGHEKAMEMVVLGRITPSMTCKQIADIVKKELNPVDEEQENEETENEETENEKQGDEEQENAIEILVIVTDESGTKYAIPADVISQYKM